MNFAFLQVGRRLIYTQRVSEEATVDLEPNYVR